MFRQSLKQVHEWGPWVPLLIAVVLPGVDEWTGPRAQGGGPGEKDNMMDTRGEVCPVAPHAYVWAVHSGVENHSNDSVLGFYYR